MEKRNSKSEIRKSVPSPHHLVFFAKSLDTFENKGVAFLRDAKEFGRI